MLKILRLLVCLFIVMSISTNIFSDPTPTPVFHRVSFGLLSQGNSIAPTPKAVDYGVVDGFDVGFGRYDTGKIFVAVHSLPSAHPFMTPFVFTKTDTTITDLTFNAHSISFVAESLSSSSAFNIADESLTWSISNNTYKVYYNDSETPGLTPITYEYNAMPGAVYSNDLLLYVNSPTVTPTFTKTPIPTRTYTKTVTKTVTKTATRTPTFTATKTRTPALYYTPTGTFTITPTYTTTKTVTQTVTPTLTTIVESATVTETSTVTPTLTITPTPFTTPQYYYSTQDILFSGSITITGTTGSFTWVNPYPGIIYSAIPCLASGPSQSIDVRLTTTNSYAILTVVDIGGTPVDCSPLGDNAIVNLFIYRNKSTFPYW